MDEGGVFNSGQLVKFDVVIFNNSTGRVLNDEQQLALENYIEQGGSLIGIHGSGDNSHNWNWYTQNLVGTEHQSEIKIMVLVDTRKMIQKILLVFIAS